MDFETIRTELQFQASRSSGPGGQHVNKTASKVTLSFHLEASQGLSEVEKERLLLRLQNQLTSEGSVQLSCSETPSQHRNKELVIQRLQTLLEDNLKVRKPRKKTKPTKLAIEKRLQTKKQQALKKGSRKPPKID